MYQSECSDLVRAHRDAAVFSALCAIVGLVFLAWNLVNLLAGLISDQDHLLAFGAVGLAIAATMLIFSVRALVREILDHQQALVQLQHALAQDAAAARDFSDL